MGGRLCALPADPLCNWAKVVDAYLPQQGCLCRPPERASRVLGVSLLISCLGASDIGVSCVAKDPAAPCAESTLWALGTLPSRPAVPLLR
jgi:hypothetical protein